MAQQAADVVEHDGSQSHRAATVRAVDGRSLALRWLKGYAAGQPKAPAEVQPHQPLDQLMVVSGTVMHPAVITHLLQTAGQRMLQEPSPAGL